MRHLELSLTAPATAPAAHSHGFTSLTYSPTECTAEEIRERYKVLSLQLHPDKQRKQDQDAQPSSLPPHRVDRVERVHACEVDAGVAAASFPQLAEAYTALKEPAARKLYDAVRLAGGVAQELPVDAEVDLDDMAWDDQSGRCVCVCASTSPSS